MQFKTRLCRHNSGDEAFLLRGLILLRVTEGTIFAKLRDHHLLSNTFLLSSPLGCGWIIQLSEESAV